ncbi:hypothetical protein [Rummeliibacillus stabekisii]|uniref:Uncharacterized protein n=1 Tax=Rummeliibacillus stabekisii TaxID=241244 RepID=A0A143HDK1_9BACL|nr:hypothetical protein [Rummeliibacillus stabekisii]AMW99772.1 hypothetical protein ATY39_10175 [Rummeliibacillus stabekisii]
MIEQAKNFSIYFERTSDWEKFAKEKLLPSTSAYIAHFGSMEKAKKEVGIEKIKTRKNYTKEELTKIALENKKYFTTEKQWDSHVKNHNLPRHKAYINAFRSWKKAKSEILGKT